MTHTNHLLRWPVYNLESLISLVVLVLFVLVCFLVGMKIIDDYGE